MKQYEMLLAEIERRKKVLTVLGEGCIVGQRNEMEYKLLCELEEFAKGLTSEVTSEISDLDMAAMEYFREALQTGNDSKMQAFKAGANWQKQQLIKQSLEAVREEFPDGTFIYSTKNLIDDDMEERGICLFDYLNVRIVLIQSI